MMSIYANQVRYYLFPSLKEHDGQMTVWVQWGGGGAGKLGAEKWGNVNGRKRKEKQDEGKWLMERGRRERKENGQEEKQGDGKSQ